MWIGGLFCAIKQLLASGVTLDAYMLSSQLQAWAYCDRKRARALLWSSLDREIACPLRSKGGLKEAPTLKTPEFTPESKAT